MTSELQVKKYIVSLYENERLTNNMLDPAATAVLTWAEAYLQSQNHLSEAELETVSEALHKLLRTINRTVGKHAALSEPELVDYLLKLSEQAMAVAAATQGGNHGKEEI